LNACILSSSRARWMCLRLLTRSLPVECRSRRIKKTQCFVPQEAQHEDAMVGADAAALQQAYRTRVFRRSGF
jgi:hypothetical protein